MSLGWILCDLFTLASSVVVVGYVLWYRFGRFRGPGGLAKCGSPLRVAMLSGSCLLYVDSWVDYAFPDASCVGMTQGVMVF